MTTSTALCCDSIDGITNSCAFQVRDGTNCKSVHDGHTCGLVHKNLEEKHDRCKCSDFCDLLQGTLRQSHPSSKISTQMTFKDFLTILCRPESKLLIFKMILHMEPGFVINAGNCWWVSVLGQHCFLWPWLFCRFSAVFFLSNIIIFSISIALCRVQRASHTWQMAWVPQGTPITFCDILWRGPAHVPDKDHESQTKGLLYAGEFRQQEAERKKIDLFIKRGVPCEWRFQQLHGQRQNLSAACLYWDMNSIALY